MEFNRLSMPFDLFFLSFTCGHAYRTNHSHDFTVLIDPPPELTKETISILASYAVLSDRDRYSSDLLSNRNLRNTALRLNLQKVDPFSFHFLFAFKLL